MKSDKRKFTIRGVNNRFHGKTNCDNPFAEPLIAFSDLKNDALLLQETIFNTIHLTHILMYFSNFCLGELFDLFKCSSCTLCLK